MKFRFKKIGPVKEAELELGDLTLIAGRNNTGKTYLVYTLYGFLKGWKSAFGGFLMSMDSGFSIEDAVMEARMGMEGLAEMVIGEGQFKHTVDGATLNYDRKTIIQALTRYFSTEALPNIFSSHRSKFEGASLEIEFSEFPKDAPPVERNYSTGETFSIHGDENDIIMTWRVEKVERQRFVDEFRSLYYQFLFPEFPEPFILSTERFGISLFYKELDFTKNQLVGLLQKMGGDDERDRFSPFFLIDKATSHYALPIKDNIDYTRSLSDLQKERSEIFEDRLFDDIKEMMEGSYKSAGDEIRFRSRTRGGFDIPLYLASSSARGLSDLYFFLRHKAKKNHLLIIDEPESHLDTKNQILLARLLARFVRAGLKVLITTHSDYIVKEINNLIMLSQDFEDKKKVVRKLRYAESDFLPPASVRAYVAENNGLVACDVDKFGVNMPTFDTVIDDINRVSNELASHLEEDGKDR